MIPYIQPVLYCDPQAGEMPGRCDGCCGECILPCPRNPHREETA